MSHKHYIVRDDKQGVCVTCNMAFKFEVVVPTSCNHTIVEDNHRGELFCIKCGEVTVSQIFKGGYGWGSMGPARVAGKRARKVKTKPAEPYQPTEKELAREKVIRGMVAACPGISTASANRMLNMLEQQ